MSEYTLKMVMKTGKVEMFTFPSLEEAVRSALRVFPCEMTQAERFENPINFFWVSHSKKYWDEYWDSRWFQANDYVEQALIRCREWEESCANVS